MNPDLMDRLKETVDAGDLHLKRMNYARDQLSDYFPLDVDSYNLLDAEQISFTDQLVFRFTKLQDLMGRKFFRLILESLEEDVENMAFIDMLSRLEKLNLLEDHQKWLELREVRNLMAHEYPLQQEIFVDDLNELYNRCDELAGIWESLKLFTLKRFNL